MSRHTDSAATTLYAAGTAWTAALYVYAVRCDVCGHAVAYPRDTPERAETATRWRAPREGWRIERRWDAHVSVTDARWDDVMRRAS